MMRRLKKPIKWIPLLFSLAFLSSACSRSPEVSVASPATIRQSIADNDAPLLLVHAWATWCQPCRVEFPEIIEISRNYRSKGLEVMLISADDSDDLADVQAFLDEHHSPVGSLISTKLDQAFIESLSPNWAGSLPASFFYANGKLLSEWEGKRSYEQYAEQIDRLLNP
jgi:thiol-disulfide isomerase/thioredoxin